MSCVASNEVIVSFTLRPRHRAAPSAAVLRSDRVRAHTLRPSPIGTVGALGHACGVGSGVQCVCVRDQWCRPVTGDSDAQRSAVIQPLGGRWASLRFGSRRCRRRRSLSPNRCVATICSLGVQASPWVAPAPPRRIRNRMHPEISIHKMVRHRATVAAADAHPQRACTRSNAHARRHGHCIVEWCAVLRYSRVGGRSPVV